MTTHTSLATCRRAWLAGGAALLLSGAAIGVASAQTTATSTPEPGRGLVVAFGASDQDLAARQQQYLQKLADKLGLSTDRLQAAIDATNQELGVPGPPPLGGKAGGAVYLKLSSDLSVAAGVLKLSEDQLKRELPNRSLADVARAHGVDPQTVAQALEAARSSELDEAAKNGKIPAAVLDSLRANLDADVQMLLNTPHAADGSLHFQKIVRKS